MLKCTSLVGKYGTNGLYARNFYFSNNFNGAILEWKGVSLCDRYAYEEFFDENMDAFLSEPFFTRRMKLPADQITSCCTVKWGLTSELLYPDMKLRRRLIIARHFFYMISDNPNVSFAIVDCSLYSRRFALKDEYHKKRMDMVAYSPLEFNYLETLANAFIIAAGGNQFIREDLFNNVPVRWIAIAMNTNYAVIGSYIENAFWCYSIILRQIRITRGGQPIVDLVAADDCRLYVTTMKAMNFQDDIPSIPIDNFKDH